MHWTNDDTTISSKVVMNDKATICWSFKSGFICSPYPLLFSPFITFSWIDLALPISNIKWRKGVVPPDTLYTWWHSELKTPCPSSTYHLSVLPAGTITSVPLPLCFFQLSKREIQFYASCSLGPCTEPGIFFGRWYRCSGIRSGSRKQIWQTFYIYIPYICIYIL